MGVLVGMTGALIISGVIVVIVLAVLCASIFIVPQQQAYIIERFGKYNKVQFAGIHAKIPFVDRISTKTNMRVSQLNVQLETKTLDNVFVTVVASTQFRVNPENVATAYYELRDPAGQLRSYMEDALRSAIPALSLDDAFARKDDVAFDVQKTVGTEMARFGFTVVKTLITAIDPSPQVKSAMDSINAAQREKEATASVPRRSASRSRRRPLRTPRRPDSRVRARPTTVVRSQTASSTRSRACRPWAWTSTTSTTSCCSTSTLM